jgi:hypothetical protein
VPFAISGVASQTHVFKCGLASMTASSRDRQVQAIFKRPKLSLLIWASLEYFEFPASPP